MPEAGTHPSPIPAPQAMTQVAKVIGFLALAGTIVPPFLFLIQALAEGPMKGIMLVSTVLWFATAPIWMKGGSH